MQSSEPVSADASAAALDDAGRRHDLAQPCVTVDQLQVELSAQAGTTPCQVGALATLCVGAIVRFDQPAGEVTLLANGRPIARAVLLDVAGSHAAQITELLDDCAMLRCDTNRESLE